MSEAFKMRLLGKSWWEIGEALLEKPNHWSVTRLREEVMLICNNEEDKSGKQ